MHEIALIETNPSDRPAMAKRLLDLAAKLDMPVVVVDTYNRGFKVPVELAKALESEARKGGGEKLVDTGDEKVATFEKGDEKAVNLDAPRRGRPPGSKNAPKVAE